MSKSKQFEKVKKKSQNEVKKSQPLEKVKTCQKKRKRKKHIVIIKKKSDLGKWTFF